MLALASEGNCLLTTPDGRKGGFLANLPSDEHGNEHSDLRSFYEFHELEPDELFVLAPMADGKPAPGHATEAEYGGHAGWARRLAVPELIRLAIAGQAASKSLGIEPVELSLDVLNAGWEHFDDRPTQLGGDEVPEVDSELMR